jgi:O-antigen/teichoic acid export membrane protein
MVFTLKKLALFSGGIEGFLGSSKKLVSESWPYISLILLNLPFSHFANNFLDLNSTTKEIGFFNLAQKLMNPVQIIVAFSVTAIFPNISQLFSKNKERFLEIVKKGMPLFVLVLGYICFLYSFFSYEIISLFFNNDYLPAVRVAQLQIWFLFFNAINTIIVTVFGAANLEKMIFKISLICALIGTPLIYYGSFYGALGISYGFVISFALFEFYLWNQFKKNLNIAIHNEILIWLSVTSLFFLSYFYPSSYGIESKILISVLLSFFFILQFKQIFISFIYKKN